MNSTVRARFWVEAGLASLSAILAVFTWVRPDWIEAATGFDPDDSNGSFEWVVVGTLLTVCLLVSLAARAEWLRARRTA